jgi:hypothetical protein
MGMTREKFNYLVLHNGGGDWKNISFIATTNSHPIFFKYYNVPGKGVDFIDIDMGSGSFITGFLIYESLAPASIDDLSVIERHEIFIDIELLDRLSFKQPVPPTYAVPLGS